jgi:hypothetical protein
VTRKGESSRIEALEALIAEKRKHEGYLAKLDERREGTPEHVYVRLRDEYLTKLTDAQVRAHAEAESIGDGLADDETAVAEIEERLKALEEEKVEGELRAAVGELDEKEWSKKLTSLKASISMAERDSDGRRAVVERTRELLAEAGSRVTGGGATAAKSGDRGSSAPPKGAPGMSGAPSFDELAFLNSVVSRNSGATPPPARASKPVEQVKSEPADSKSEEKSEPKPESPAARKTPARAATPTAPAEAAPAQQDAKQEAAASAPDARTSGAKAEPAKAEPAKPEPAKAPEPAPLEPDDAFGRPTPRTTQAVKTLKCQECGTFNYPTEWYCERCGGELAAL